MLKASDLIKADLTATNLTALQQQISNHYAVDEQRYLEELLSWLDQNEQQIHQLTDNAEKLISQVRSEAKGGDGIDAFLQEYSLDTQEGIILMCLAEALLRIPDSETADALIKDKLKGADWAAHFKNSDSLLVNASTWGLMLTGKVIKLDNQFRPEPSGLLNRLLNKMGEPVVRNAMYAAMKIMGKQFVLGRSIQEALKNSQNDRSHGYTHSYDMLGEGAITSQDANQYFDAYANAICSIGGAKLNAPAVAKPSISIKLSALHPRYEEANRERVLTELTATTSKLVALARQQQVGLTIDAEEADRLELSLALFERVYRSDSAKGWGQFGIVVQAYSKRALPVLIWITALARQQGDEIPVRLVKGAYWDSEIKHCQQIGDVGYPVFTRKAATDVSYIACAKYLLSEHTLGCIFPQFATHNAHTVAAIQALAGFRQYEFQRLHGMGSELYNSILKDSPAIRVRVYAPVGEHKDLLPYLVRRLLENGANTSFVHKLIDPNEPVTRLSQHPINTLRQVGQFANPHIKLPEHIFADRKNAQGINMTIAQQRHPFFEALASFAKKQWIAKPLIAGEAINTKNQLDLFSPYAPDSRTGQVHFANETMVNQAFIHATQAFTNWRDSDIEQRAQCLENMAELMELNKVELISLCQREAGKTLQDSIDEIKEAVDFCRYYANQGRALFTAQTMPGPTGEENKLYALGRGTFVCISPWNFPLAIFLGQVVAALVTGNTVIAKPAEQTSLIAHRAIELLHQAGIPKSVVQFLPGTGAAIGHALTSHPAVAGVCFTGSTQTAKHIQLSLAEKPGAIAPLIAETGGQNAMIVDSTALPEQVIKDVISSAFASAGQRCSALRVLFVQQDIAKHIERLLTGAMQELIIGDPLSYKTDVGPVIDKTAQQKLLAHIEDIQQQGQLIYQCQLTTQQGHFVAPTAVRIKDINQLQEEKFGPILHIIHYNAESLPQVIAQINATGYGLTLGIHTRNESLAAHIASQVNVGNVYINRNQIGAVVGVQPFGGQGLSGTGPKAGGPHYLSRFITEKTISNNITAIGGNASLLAMGDN